VRSWLRSSLLAIAASLLPIVATAARPADLRDDGGVVLGCSSLEWVTTHRDAIPIPLVRDALDQLLVAGKFGADPAEPLWTVLGERDGRMLPFELRLSLPEGARIPPGVGMFIGSPRITQDGTQVRAMWAPVGETRTGLLALTDRVEGPVGCVAASRPPDAGQFAAVALFVGPDPDHVTAVFEGWNVRPGDPALVRILPLIQTHSAEAPWNALAASPEAPQTALRLNIDARPSEFLGLLDPPPPAAVLKAVDRVLLHPGTEVGIWPDAQGRPTEVAAVVPVRRPRTVMWWPGKLARQLARQGQPVERRGRVVGIPLDEAGERLLWISSRRGRLLLGTNPDRLAAMRKLEGEAWFPRGEPVGPVESSHAPGLVISTRTPRTAGVIAGRDGLLFIDAELGPGAVIPGLTGPAPE
jgi:hypothetical protein